jgi:hypothetical protein
VSLSWVEWGENKQEKDTFLNSSLLGSVCKKFILNAFISSTSKKLIQNFEKAYNLLHK